MCDRDMRKQEIVVLAIILLGLPCNSHDSQQYSIGNIALSDEKRLIKHLLDNYHRVGIVGRPVYNTSETVNVSYGLALIQILDLDEKNQVLTTNVWNRYTWNDILLRWNPAQFGGVDHVRVPANKIWTPDIVLYNYADTRLKEQRDALAVISSEGDVLWIPMAIFKSTCPINIRHFPFDEQTCRLKFGSWTYDGFKLDLHFYEGLEKVDVNDYIESNEWALLEYPAKKNNKRYPCCVAPFPDLTFTLHLKRIAAFYNYILILPCVLLSSLTLVIFWLPPESPAKMMLGMNIFVAFFVLLLLLAESTPPAASSIPLIGAYFCLNMILITLSTFLSVVVINLYFRGDRKNSVPHWLKTIIVEGLARILCMYEPFASDNQKPLLRPSSAECPPAPPPSSLSSSSSSPHRRHSKDRKKVKCPELKYNKFQTPPVMDYRDAVTRGGGPVDRSPLHHQPMEGDVREIKRILRTYIGRLQEKDSQARVNREWRVVARVLDRLFFFLYVITIIVSLATIFPRG